MLSWTIALCAPMSLLGADGATYADAHKVTTETGKPLVVMVGTGRLTETRVFFSTLVPPSMVVTLTIHAFFPSVASPGTVTRPLMEVGVTPVITTVRFFPVAS